MVRADHSAFNYRFNDSLNKKRYDGLTKRKGVIPMMNLKDAFRAQNRLEYLMDQADDILTDSRNTMKTKVTHLRSKVMADAQDAETVDTAPSEYAEQINLVAAFLMEMLSQREKLSKAIQEAKTKLPLDMDSETGLNRVRQNLAYTFRSMAALKATETVLPGGGSGFRFNAEGNQVTYRCDAKKVTTINFDRNKIRGMASTLGKKSDEISAQLDQCLVNAQVDYELPFDLNDSFDVVLSDYIEAHTEKAN